MVCVSVIVYERESVSYMALKRSIGMGAQVINTERRRNDFRPHASERAPIRGAERNDRRPYNDESRQRWCFY